MIDNAVKVVQVQVQNHKEYQIGQTSLKILKSKPAKAFWVQ